MCEFDVAVVDSADEDLERREHLAPVTSGSVDEQSKRVVVGGGSLGLQSPSNERLDRRPVERFEAEQRRAAAQRSVHLEKRVLRRCSDQGQRAVLHCGEQRILL